MNSNKPLSNSEYLAEAIFREYDAIKSEMRSLIELRTTIQLATLTALGGVILLIDYVSKNSSGQNATFYLFAALVFCALGWHQLNTESVITDLGRYITLHLAPRIQGLIENEGLKPTISVFGWDSFYRNGRYKNIWGVWLGIGVIGRTILPPLAAMVLLSLYFQTPKMTNSFTDLVLIALVFLALFWIIIASFRIHYQFRSNNLDSKKEDNSKQLKKRN